MAKETKSRRRRKRKEKKFSMMKAMMSMRNLMLQKWRKKQISHKSRRIKKLLR